MLAPLRAVPSIRHAFVMVQDIGCRSSGGKPDPRFTGSFGEASWYAEVLSGGLSVKRILARPEINSGLVRVQDAPQPLADIDRDVT